MKNFLISIKTWLILTLLTGVIYPLIVTGAGYLVAPFQAGGSLVVLDGKTSGSRLVAQNWGPGWFQARPSAVNYDSMSSGASNLSATSAKLREARAAREEAWQQRTGTGIPREMAAASGSGLDPDISVETARAQAAAVLRERGLGPEVLPLLLVLIERASRGGGLFGEGPPLVNVQDLNHAMSRDAVFAVKGE